MHRDLKPENFLLKAKHATVDHPCTQWNVRCIDFGSAAIVRPGACPPPRSRAPASLPRLPHPCCKDIRRAVRTSLDFRYLRG